MRVVGEGVVCKGYVWPLYVSVRRPRLLANYEREIVTFKGRLAGSSVEHAKKQLSRKVADSFYSECSFSLTYGA